MAPTEISSPENTYEYDEPQINSPDSITETNTTDRYARRTKNTGVHKSEKITGVHVEQKQHPKIQLSNFKANKKKIAIM